MKSYLFDTNFILRFLLNDIPQQAKIVSDYLILAKKEEIKIYIPILVLIEAEFALRKFYKLSKNKVLNMLESILLTPYIEIEKKDLMIDVLDFYKNNNFEFVDLVIFFESKYTHHELLTFDSKLKKLSI